MACSSSPPAASQSFSEAEIRQILTLSPVPDPPPDPTNRWSDDPAAATFGATLFHDTRFSANGQVSCATCHQRALAFTDGKSLSTGIGTTGRHSPTLTHVAHQRWLFWDGRADTLWGQALGPLEDPNEHGGTREQYAQLIADDPRLRAEYEAIFGGLPDNFADDRSAATLVFVNMGKSIAAFERSLTFGQTRFDTFVEGLRDGDLGKQRALNPSAQLGLKLFIGRARCNLCHSGPLFTDLEFHSIGVGPLDPDLPPDQGRMAGISKLKNSEFNGVGRWSDDPTGPAHLKVDYLDTDRAVVSYKTPTLRNVAITAPYMHQGQLDTLEQVVDFYDTLQDADLSGTPEKILIPLKLATAERAGLVAFMESLNSE